MAKETKTSQDIKDDIQKTVKQADKKMKKSLQDTKEFVELSTEGFLSKQNIVDALSYIPYFVGPVLMYFFGNADKQKTMHHIKYAIILAIGAAVLSLVLNQFFTGALNLAYVIVSGFLGFKALRGDNVQIQMLDTLEDQVSKTIKK